MLSYFQPVEVSQTDIASNRVTYNQLLDYALYGRAKARNTALTSDTPTLGEFTKHIIKWLDSTDFYTAPASTQYHESFEGGLVYHSLQVYNQVLDLIKLPKFQSVDISSAVFVALIHDWCKINIYESYLKNVKDESGNWIKETAYRQRKRVLSAGHGAQSVIDAILLCNTPYSSLTEDEIMAIRWHMYTYDVTSYDLRPLNDCGSAIPLVHLIQFADQLAIVDY